MIGLKKFVSNELLQIALLLSLIRHRGDHLINNNVEYESPTVGVGGRSEWNQTVYVSHNPTIHPKSIVNYHEDLIHELNSLGRYNRIDFSSDVTAYLLNVNDTAGQLPLPSGGEGGGLPSQPAASTTEAGNETRVDPVEGGKAVELSKEDMAIIETLWKEDAARGGGDLAAAGGLRPLNPPAAAGATSSNDTEPDPSSSATEETFDEGISGGQAGPAGCVGPAASQLVAGYQYNGQLSPSSSKSLDHADLDFCKDFDNDEFFPATLDELYPPSKMSYLDIDSGDLDLDLKPECADEDEPGFLLPGDDESQDLFSYPKDDFLISNALELCELNDCCDQGASSTGSAEIKEEKEELEDLDLLFQMMQTAQYHPPRAYHQSRVPYVRSALGIPPPSTSDPAHHQRWQDYQNSSSYPPHHHHHHGHLPYGHATNISAYSHHSHGQEAGGLTGALIHNATLPPPMGDLNNTSPYHIGASPNVSSAVTSSMNLTNCDTEHSIMTSASAGYKMDNDSVFYQHNISNQSLNNQTESFFPSLLNDEDLQLMDMAMNESMYGSMLDNVTSPSPHASQPLPSSSLGLVAPHPAASLAASHTLVATDRCTDSDSAVSSMGSERVPSLSSDNEWMETNSDSGHTPGDHYSAEYSKYRWYDNYMYLRSHSMGGESPSSSSHRLPPPAVAQKKYQLYGRRLFHDHNSTAASTSSDISSVDSAHIKYELNDTDTTRVDEARYNSSEEVKYSCMAEFARTNHRASLSELVSHNHTYSTASLASSLPVDSLGTASRNYMKDKTAKYIQKLKMVDFAARKSEEEQMTRDEKKARALSVPIPVPDIINLPMDEFNERLSKYDLSETQLSLIRDIRRRGKNKVAAQNCRKRKLDQILSLADEVKQMRDKKRHLCQEHEYLSQETLRVKSRFSQLYKHVFNALRDSDGNPYSPFEFSLEQTNDGNVELVRRSAGHLPGHASTSGKDNSSTNGGSQAHDPSPYRNKHHRDYHDHRKE